MFDFKQLDQELERWENFLNDLKKNFKGKSSSRFFSSYGWMHNHLEQAVQEYLAPIKKSLIMLGEEYEERQHTIKYINTGKALLFAKNLEETLLSLAEAYKQEESFEVLSKKIEDSFKSMTEDASHLRKRINLIRGFSGLVQEL